MNVYWYWPFAKPEELSLCDAVVRSGVRLTVHTLPRSARSAPATFLHLPTLPEISGRYRSASPLRVISRALTYWRRHRARRRAITDIDPDIVHVFFVNRYTDGVFGLGGLRHERTILNVHDLRPHDTRTALLDDWLLRRAYRRAGKIVVHHEALAQRLRRDLPPDRDVITIPHPVFFQGSRSSPANRRELRLLFFGTLRRNKGIKVLLEAARILENETSIAIHVAGHGDPDLERLVRRAADERPNVTAAVGWQDFEQKSDAFAAAAIIVLPYTEFSSQSGVLHDAYGFGRPVLGTDVGALGDTIRADGTGWVVPPADAQALARKILEIRERPLLSEDALAAVERVRSTRNVEVIADRLLGVYREMLQPSASPAEGSADGRRPRSRISSAGSRRT